MTLARLAEIVAAMRSPEGCACSAAEMSTAFLLLASIRDAERALRHAEEIVSTAVLNGEPIGNGIDVVRERVAALRALGVDP